MLLRGSTNILTLVDRFPPDERRLINSTLEDELFSFRFLCTSIPVVIVVRPIPIVPLLFRRLVGLSRSGVE